MNKIKNLLNKTLSVLLLICLMASNFNFSVSAAEPYTIGSDPTLDTQYIQALANKGVAFSYNDTRDAFLSSKYYNSSSLLGVAGSFAVVAFNQAVLSGSHVNGNVLTKDLQVKTSFGTKALVDELSYAQNISALTVGQLAGNDSNAFAVGNSVNVQAINTQFNQESGKEPTPSTTDIAINGTKIEKPKNFIKDSDTANSPYVDIDAVFEQACKLNKLLGERSTNYNIKSYSIDISGNGANNRYIEISDKNAASYFNMTAEQLTGSGVQLFKMSGFSSTQRGSLIINVDCKDVAYGSTVKLPQQMEMYVDEVQVSHGEKDKSDFDKVGKVILNFVNAEDKNITIEVGSLVGSIIAPYSNVHCVSGNLNGTVIAQNVDVGAELHRCDFTGTLDPANTEIKGVKYIKDGNSTNAADKPFTFVMTEVNSEGKPTGFSKTTTNGTDGRFKFDGLTYNKAGTYYYTVQEQNAGKTINLDGVKYSCPTTIYNVKVVVGSTTKEENGVKNTQCYIESVTYNDDNSIESMVFENEVFHFAPVSISLTAKKEVNGISGGKANSAADNFDFGIYNASYNGGTYTADYSNTVATATSENGGNIVFNDFKTYSETGNHYYAIKEIQDSTNTDVIYDETVYFFTVAVTEQGNSGKLKAEVKELKKQISSTGNQEKVQNKNIIFNNIITTTISLNGSKSVNGESSEAANGYSFELYDAKFENNAYSIVGAGAKQTVTSNVVNGANGRFTFSNIEQYSKAGSYYYAIKEVGGNNDGVVYDDTVYYVVVNVKNNSGTLTATVDKVIKNGTTAVTNKEISFNNMDEVYASVSGAKKLDNLLAGGYLFELYNASYNESAGYTFEGASAYKTATSDSNGAFSFENIGPFSKAGKYYYAIKETKSNANGTLEVVYDQSVYFVTVEVVKSNGKLVASIVKVDAAADGKTSAVSDKNIVFYNMTPTSVQFSGTKTYNGDAITSSNQKGPFKFELYEITKDSNGNDIYTALGQRSGDDFVLSNEADGSFTFDEIKYNAEGEYHYQIKEVIPVDAGGNEIIDGNIYDRSYYDINVTVSNNNNQLVASYTVARVDANGSAGVGDDCTNVVFNNKDREKGFTNLALGGVKTHNGTVASGYSFELYSTVLDASGKETGTRTIIPQANGVDYVASGADGKFSFADIRYDEAGTYGYIVKETVGSDSKIAYDATEHLVVVTVQAQSAWLLKVSGVTVDGKAVDFENNYVALNEKISFNNMDKVYASVNGIKKLNKQFTGGYKFSLYNAAKSENGTFSFVDTVIANATSADETGAFSFENIGPFSKAGVYYYAVKENVDNKDENIVYDEAVYYVAVTVSEENNRLAAPTITVYDKDGKVISGDIVFNNKSVTPTSISLGGLKKVDGGTSNAGGYTFALYNVTKDENGAYIRGAQVGSDANSGVLTAVLGSGFEFEKIDYDKVGTYYYEIEETGKDAKTGIVYDDAVYRLAVTVARVGDALEAKVTELSKLSGGNSVALSLLDSTGNSLTTKEITEQIVFNNMNKITVDLKGLKTVDGKTANAGGYSFNLYKTDENYTVAAGSTSIANVNSKNGGSFTFEKIGPFDKAGIYYYVIKEDASSANSGIIYDDSTVYEVAIKVEADDSGKLVATTTLDGKAYDENATSIVFNNMNKITVDLKGLKTVDGNTTDAGGYSFNLYKTDEKYTVTAGSTSIADKTSDSNGSFTFEKIGPFDKAGTYYYVLKENKSNSNDGIIYDETVHQIAINVFEENGKLVATTTVDGKAYDENATPIAFNNMTQVEVTLKALKKVDGNTTDAGGYSFLLTETGVENPYTDTSTDNGGGNYSFKTIKYTAEGTHTYTVTEDKTNPKSGIIYGLDSYTVTVEVKLNDAKTALVAITKVDGKAYNANSTQIVFNNYAQKASGDIEGLKTFDREIAANMFSFKLVEIADDGTVVNDNVQTVYNDANGSFKFDSIIFDEIKTYHYKVVELNENSQGITDDNVLYDDNAFFVDFDVAKDGNTLKVTKTVFTKDDAGVKTTLNANDKITFNNTTVKDIPTSTDFAGIKEVNDGVPNRAFTFVLTDISNPDSPREVATTECDETNGSFSFDNVPLNREGDYTFMITEKAQTVGEAGYDADMAFDNAAYTVRLSVEKVGRILQVKQGSKELLVGKNYVPYDAANNQIVFENRTKAKIEFGGVKYLNENPTAGYTFLIKETTAGVDADKLYEGNAISADDGSFTFDEIPAYSAVGEYTYEITEQNGGKVTDSVYNSTDKYTVKVNVSVSTDEQTKGRLKAEIIETKLNGALYTQGDIAFNNISIMRSSFRLSSFSIPGTKTVNGKTEGLSQGMFRFELLLVNDDGSENVIATATNNADGSFAFRNISVYEPNTYNVKIREVNGGQIVSGVTYDDTVYTGTIKIDDNGTKTVSKFTNSNTGEELDVPCFNNVAMTKISVEKTWVDANDEYALRPNEITATLYANGKETGTTITLSETNGWKAAFENLPMVDDNGEKIVYSVKEEEVSSYTSSVEVLNDEYGYTLFKFTNTLSESIAVEVDPVVVKRFEGGTLRAGQFEFELYQKDENGNKVGPIDVKSNLADGHVIFNKLFFAKEGKYDYYIKEIVPTNMDGRVDYDTKEIKAEITVTRNLSTMALEAKVQYTVDGKLLEETAPSFNNKYDPIVLQLRKVARDLNEVTPLVNAVYALYRVNENGANDIFIMQRVSDKDGYMYFNDIEPGYWYYFKEVSSPDGYEVDPYPTEPFFLNSDGSQTVKANATQETSTTNSAEENTAQGLSYAAPIEGTSVSPLAKANASLPIKTAKSASSVRTAAFLDATLGTTKENAMVNETLENNGENSDVMLLGTVVITTNVSDPPTRLDVAKMDYDNPNNFVVGASMQLIDESTNNVIYSWTTGNSIESIVRTLNVGEVYIIREVSAPSGYAKAADTRVIIDEYGNLTMTAVAGADAQWQNSNQVNIYDMKLGITRYNTIVRRGARTDDASSHMLQLSIMFMAISLVAIALIVLVKLNLKRWTTKKQAE